MFSKKDLQKLIIPLIIEQLLGISVGMFDTIMISSLGESAVSGVSLVDMLNVLMINIFAALATGGAVICAYELGKIKKLMEQDTSVKNDFPGARSAAKQLLIVLLVASILVAGLALFFRVGLLRLCFGAIEDDVMANALTYFVISAISYPFIAIYNGLAALFRTMGNSKITMIASFFMNMLNICGNALFIYVFNWGVAGAAWSTTISRFLGMLLLFVIISNKNHEIYINLREKFRLDFHVMKKILGIGIPGSLENSVFQLGRILVISMIAGFGTTQVAANAVANNLDSLGCIPGQALGLAVVTVVGQCIGAGDYDSARQYEQKLLKFAYLSMAVVNILILVSLPLSLKLYSLTKETLELAAILVILHDGFAMIFWPTAFVLPNALRAAQDVRFTMVVSIFSMIAFRIFFSWVIGVRFGMGIIGVWIAMIIDWVFRGGLFIWRVRSGRWLTHVKPKNS
ncbi:MAG: MATE family efflux transporter [Eubacteriales bacterium]|nr:MATE family efflux transporter [Clostridiales bacterium]MDD7300498.1 MATE family efflux transporter [Eubacteriales bacterium]MDY4433598.1 MATE family efflux transporter [Candidatus Flemingibacterium sp.]